MPKSMERVDTVLKDRFPKLSRIFLQKLIQEGRVSVNGRMVKKAHYSVQRADEILCDFPEPRKSHILPKEGKLNVIFEDRDIVVLDKPAGISVHPSFTDKRDTMVSFLLAHCRDLSGIGGVLRPGIVHRLDRDTSGLLVVAKNDQAHRLLAVQWAAREVEKEYTALVAGTLPSRAGRIEAPIGRSHRDRKKMAVTIAHGSREAFTDYQVVKTFGNVVSVVRVFPKTGRTHQIRVHFASLHHPVIGDALYGDKKLNAKFRDEFGLNRQFLHASRISFRHPRTGKRMSFRSKLPPDLAEVLRKLSV